MSLYVSIVCLFSFIIIFGRETAVVNAGKVIGAE